MTSIIRTSLAALTLAGAATLGALAVSPAQAEAVSMSTAAQASFALPRCVTVWQKVGRISKRGYAYNGCRYNVRMKIVWAREMDGPCTTVAPGRTISSKRSRGPASFDGARTC